MKKPRFLATFTGIAVFASILSLTPIVAQAKAVVPPVGSTCETDKSGNEQNCTFPDGSKWICTNDLKKCHRMQAKPSTLIPTNRPLGMSPEKLGNGQPAKPGVIATPKEKQQPTKTQSKATSRRIGQTPIGKSDLIEKKQPADKPTYNPAIVPQGKAYYLMKNGKVVKKFRSGSTTMMSKKSDCIVTKCPPQFPGNIVCWKCYERPESELKDKVVK